MVDWDGDVKWGVWSVADTEDRLLMEPELQRNARLRGEGGR